MRLILATVLAFCFACSAPHSRIVRAKAVRATPVPTATPTPEPTPEVRHVTAPARAVAVRTAATATRTSNQLGSDGSVAQLIREIFHEQPDTALRIFWCESTHRPTAKNGSHYGVAQLSRPDHEARANRLGFTWDDMWDARSNLLVAHDLWLEQGWDPWEQCA